MNSIGNLLWILLGGFFIFMLYLIGSIILMITIIGIPFGIQTLKLSSLALFPFGREAVPTQRASGCLHVAMNVIWILVAGVEIAVIHLVIGLICAITIIGIPCARQHFKLAYLAIIPFGMEIRDIK